MASYGCFPTKSCGWRLIWRQTWQHGAARTVPDEPPTSTLNDQKIHTGARADHRRVVLVTGPAAIDRLLAISGAAQVLVTTTDPATLD